MVSSSGTKSRTSTASPERRPTTSWRTTLLKDNDVTKIICDAKTIVTKNYVTKNLDRSKDDVKIENKNCYRRSITRKSTKMHDFL